MEVLCAIQYKPSFRHLENQSKKIYKMNNSPFEKEMGFLRIAIY